MTDYMTNFDHEMVWLRKIFTATTPYSPNAGDTMKMQIVDGGEKKDHYFTITFEHLVALNEFRE